LLVATEYIHELTGGFVTWICKVHTVPSP
jgi:hypothetical protein